MDLGDLSKPLGQRRPKIMEQRPNPPPPTSFEIDERKLRAALPPVESSAADDARVLGSIACVVLMVLGVLVCLVDVFFHFLSSAMLFALALTIAGLWLLQRFLLPDEGGRIK